MNTMLHYTNGKRTVAVLLVACSLTVGSPASHAAGMPATVGVPSQAVGGKAEKKGESGVQRERSAEDALALLEILRTADSFDPTDWDNRLVFLTRAARRFPASEELARSLFRALGPKPQILSAEFDPADGHIVHMVTQETIVRTDAKLAPVPDWVLEFAGALVGEFTVERNRTIPKQVIASSATDVWTRQAKWAFTERMAAVSLLTSSDQAASRLGWETYNRTCALCHGSDGRGIHNTAPPLAGSEWALATEPDRLIRIALHGLQGPIKVRGKPLDNMACPAFGAPMSDMELAAALTYIRSNRFWGHALPSVSGAEVKAIREATKSRSAPWTAAELLGPSAGDSSPNPRPVDKPMSNSTWRAPSTKPSEYE